MRTDLDHACRIFTEHDRAELQRLRAKYLCRGCSRSFGEPRVLPGWSAPKNYCERCWDEVIALLTDEANEFAPPVTWDPAWWLIVACGALAAWILAARVYGWAPWGS